MQNPEKYIGTYSTIEKEMQVLEEFVDNYRNLLNSESIWLFLATLGCWSVSQHNIQIFAFLITLYLFFERLSVFRDNSRSFKEYVQIIESRVNQLELNDKTRSEWFCYIENYKNCNISFSNNLKQTKIFLLGLSFYLFSFAYFVHPNWFGS